MPSNDLRKRIEALNRRPLQNVPEPEQQDTPEIKALRRKLTKQAAMSVPTAPPRPRVSEAPVSVPHPVAPPSRHSSGPRDFGPAVTLEEVVSGIVTEAPAGPGYYLIEKQACELEPNAPEVYSHFTRLTGHPDGEAVIRIASTCKTERIAPEEILFLDLETTGLGMTPVFLVGTMECVDGCFVFKQYFARDYSEEMSIVSAISQRLRSVRMLVTFNGKTFDVPFLKNRATATRVSLCHAHNHLDLLHEARRIYRGKLPDCKLQTLEQYVCGRTREDDIPGAEIPKAYHDFVRTGNANKIGPILLHNLYDLLTMADLMRRMWV